MHEFLEMFGVFKPLIAAICIALPLAIPVAIGFRIYDTWVERREARRRAELEAERSTTIVIRGTDDGQDGMGQPR